LPSSLPQRRQQSPTTRSDLLWAGETANLRRDGKGLMEPVCCLTYVGHATVLIEMDGVRILTDPVLRDHMGPLRRQVAPPDPSCRHVDAVLISHPHLDHLDPPSLRLLKGDPDHVVPTGVAAFLNRQGLRQVREIEPGEQTFIGDVVVEATPASHSGRRPPFGPTTDCIGFLIRGSYRIYFAGDTDVFPEMRDLGDDLDVALLPVWGWGLTLGTGHMDPLRAAQALAQLCPRVAIPVHWGTYGLIGVGWMRPGFLSRPPRDFASYAAAHAPGVEVCILEPGESFCLANRLLDPVTSHNPSD
jgi:L-ascorbate metabolism protein UlaG (beta-lactamase superfamily)